MFSNPNYQPQRKLCPICRLPVYGPGESHIQCQAEYNYQLLRKQQLADSPGKGKKRCPICQGACSARKAKCECGYRFHAAADKEDFTAYDR